MQNTSVKMKGEEKKEKKRNKQAEILDELKKEAEEYRIRYLRALADYQNLEKRIGDERKEIIANTLRNFILKLLPIVDNLETAERFIQDQGLKMIKSQFTQILQDEGVEEIIILGKEFDPHLAEAIEIVPGNGENIVCEVVRKGYKIGNKVVQPAQVKVTKKNNQDTGIKDTNNDQ